jgi:hypothetical protein
MTSILCLSPVIVKLLGGIPQITPGKQSSPIPRRAHPLTAFLAFSRHSLHPSLLTVFQHCAKAYTDDPFTSDNPNPPFFTAVLVTFSIANPTEFTNSTSSANTPLLELQLTESTKGLTASNRKQGKHSQINFSH